MVEQDKDQEGEAETRKSLAEGRGITFPNAKEAIKWLKIRDETAESETGKMMKTVEYCHKCQRPTTHITVRSAMVESKACDVCHTLIYRRWLKPTDAKVEEK